MVETYRVVWEPEAQADLFEAVGFIAERNPTAARRVSRSLDVGAASLGHHPHRGRRVPEWAALAEFAELAGSIEVRELVLRPWRLLYVVKPSRVRIIAVVDSRRDMAAWLERHVERFP